MTRAIWLLWGTALVLFLLLCGTLLSACDTPADQECVQNRRAVVVCQYKLDLALAEAQRCADHVQRLSETCGKGAE